jgi:hypothetical protein
MATGSLLKKTILGLLPENIKHFLRSKMNLVRVPNEINSAISDLFPFRIDDGWETHFELLNVPFLIDPINQSDVSYNVRFVFFDEKGNFFYEWTTEQKGCFRRTISINELLKGQLISGNGTFACFHEKYLPNLIDQKAFVAERGYSGYMKKSISKVKGYVHGNLDAMAMSNNNKLICLGKNHFKVREFRLQHQLTGPATYQLGFVNTSIKAEILTVEMISLEKPITKINQKIPSRGIVWITHELGINEIVRVVIHSKLNLPRPIVFRIMDNSFDVFHG